MRLDGCNGFVFAGGILWLCLIGVALIYAAKVIRDRRLASGTGPAPLVQLSESRVPNSDAEALPDSAPYGAEISKPSESPVAFVPNSEGYLFSNSLLLFGLFCTLLLMASDAHTIQASH
jgi:hypothetical protein